MYTEYPTQHYHGVGAANDMHNVNGVFKKFKLIFYPNNIDRTPVSIRFQSNT